MRLTQRLVVGVVWAARSAVCSAALVYLGAGAEVGQSRWPAAAVAGAVVGGAGGVLTTRVWPGRGGLLLGLPFGALQAALLWGRG